jgi:hypothetical protein|tara:strand:- start:858 stop:1040 length:183 start_codon:yes stop_codon:yes gene_type:complete
MAVTPKMGVTEADNFFGVEDELTTDALRQVFDNIRSLRKEVIVLRSRVLSLETEKDTDLL